MSSIVVSPKNPNEFQFLSELLKKLGADVKVLSDEEMEDIGLSILLKEADRSEVASEEDVLSKLKG